MSVFLTLIADNKMHLSTTNPHLCGQKTTLVYSLFTRYQQAKTSLNRHFQTLILNIHKAYYYCYYKKNIIYNNNKKRRESTNSHLYLKTVYKDY